MQPYMQELVLKHVVKFSAWFLQLNQGGENNCHSNIEIGNKIVAHHLGLFLPENTLWA